MFTANLETPTSTSQLAWQQQPCFFLEPWRLDVLVINCNFKNLYVFIWQATALVQITLTKVWVLSWHRLIWSDLISHNFLNYNRIFQSLASYISWWRSGLSIMILGCFAAASAYGISALAEFAVESHKTGTLRICDLNSTATIVSNWGVNIWLKTHSLLLCLRFYFHKGVLYSDEVK